MEATPCNHDYIRKDRCTIYHLEWLLPRRNERRFTTAHSIDVVGLPMRVYILATDIYVDGFQRLFGIDQSDGNV